MEDFNLSLFAVLSGVHKGRNWINKGSPELGASDEINPFDIYFPISSNFTSSLVVYNMLQPYF